MPGTDGAPAPTLGSAVLVHPWVHRSPGGVEVGPEAPSGDPSPALVAFVAALRLTWELRELLWALVLKDFKSRYRAQALGLFWSLAHPLVMMVTLTIAFQQVMRIAIENFAVFYLVGSVFWHFFTNATLAALGSLVENGGLVKQTTFPRFLFPIAAVLSHLVHFGMELVLVFSFMLVFPDAYHLNASLLALPILTLLVLVIAAGAALATAGLHVKYRDVHYVVTSLFTVGFWATPILYPLDMAPAPLRAVIRLNPLTGVIEGARAIILRGVFPSALDLVPAAVTGALLFLVGCAIFRRQNLHVADYL